MFLRKSLCAYLAAAVFVAGCGDDNTGPGEDLVTIAGVVRNVDTTELAEGVRVTLLGTNYSDEVATGSDGAYSLQVPRGSTLLLHTDDFNSAVDEWIPLINVDVPNVVANGDMPDFPIHCCPQTSGEAFGSVAIWDNYLQNADDQSNGNKFVPTHVNDSGGVITALFWFCEGGQSSPVPSGMSMEIDASEFPVGYMNCSNVDGLLVANGPEIVYPAPRMTTDEWGWVCSFGDPAFTGDSVTLTVTDTDAMRGYNFTSPFEVPVRAGTLTLIWYAATDGTENVTFKELGECVGLF